MVQGMDEWFDWLDEKGCVIAPWLADDRKI